MLKDRNFIMFLITTGLEIFRTVWSERKREREELKTEKEKQEKDVVEPEEPLDDKPEE